MGFELDPIPPDPPAPPRIGPVPLPPPPPIPRRLRRDRTLSKSVLGSVAIHAAAFFGLAWSVHGVAVREEPEVSFELTLRPPDPIVLAPEPSSTDPMAEPGGKDARTETPNDSDAQQALGDQDRAVHAKELAPPEDPPEEPPVGAAGIVGVGLGGGGTALEGRAPRASFEGRLGGRERLLLEGGGDASTEGALLRALNWLAEHQSVDGTWSARGFAKRCKGRACDGVGEEDYREATTALALLPFLGAGNTPDEGRWRSNVSRAVQVLVAGQHADGSWASHTNQGYASALATLALSEAYGMTGSDELRAPAQRAVDFWVRTQSSAGGWRYSPGDGDADSSVTGWVATALASARRAGLDVPQRTILGCRNWFEKRTSKDGTVGYTAPGSGSAALLGTGLFVETLLGADPGSPRLRATAAQLGHRLPRLPQSDDDAAAEYGVADPIHWFYGGLGAFQRGGDLWTVWELRLRGVLLPSQERSGDLVGSWRPIGASGRAGGRVVTTALCALALEVYYRYPRVTMTSR